MKRWPLRTTGQHSSGFSALSEIFDVDVVLSSDGEPVRGFEYSKCLSLIHI